MKVMFCGHSSVNFESYNEIKNKLLKILIKELNGCSVDFYLGGYGYFDNLSKECCDEYKKVIKDDCELANKVNIKTIFVTPYIDEDYLKRNSEMIKQYDEIIYPNLENTPRRYAILKRNYWMAKQADLVIAYVKYNWGGASKTLDYARKMNKRIINLCLYEL